MAGINSLKGLRNVNLTSVKEGAKKTAALTLLLSTVACSYDEYKNSGLECIVIPIVSYLAIVGIVGGIVEIVDRTNPPSPDIPPDNRPYCDQYKDIH